MFGIVRRGKNVENYYCEDGNISLAVEMKLALVNF